MKQMLWIVFQATIIGGCVYLNAIAPDPAPFFTSAFGGVLVAMGLTAALTKIGELLRWGYRRCNLGYRFRTGEISTEWPHDRARFPR